jgi:hypothetical protein
MGTVQPTRWNTTAARFQTGPPTAAELADICELAEKAAVSAVGLAWPGSRATTCHGCSLTYDRATGGMAERYLASTQLTPAS